MSWRPSVCPSANFSCPFHNSDTIPDIFMKLGTNVNHHQTMCREQDPKLHLHFYGTILLFQISLLKSCPFYNFNTVENIFMKLGKKNNNKKQKQKKKKKKKKKTQKTKKQNKTKQKQQQQQQQQNTERNN